MLSGPYVVQGFVLNLPKVPVVEVEEEVAVAAEGAMEEAVDTEVDEGVEDIMTTEVVAVVMTVVVEVAMTVDMIEIATTETGTSAIIRRLYNNFMELLITV